MLIFIILAVMIVMSTIGCMIGLATHNSTILRWNYPTLIISYILMGVYASIPAQSIERISSMDMNTIAFTLLGLCGLFWAIALTAAIKLHKLTEQASIKRLARICYAFGSLSVATVVGLLVYIFLTGH